MYINIRFHKKAVEDQTRGAVGVAAGDSGRKVEEKAPEEKGIEALPPLTELKKLNARQLKSLCTARGLPTRGKKTTLIERLQRHGEGAKLEL